MSAASGPLIVNRFIVHVDDVEIGSFREVHGLRVDVDVFTMTEGGQNQFSHKLPGRMTWPNVVLRCGMTTKHLFEWLAQTSGDGYAGKKNELKRATAAVTLVDPKGKRVRTFELLEAFPVRWKGPDCVADSVEIVEEELEIAHHGFTIKDL